jgi:type I restriction enzyme M protein
MNHVIEKIRAAEMAKWGKNLRRAETAVQGRIRKFAGKYIVGMDFNPELVKASKMNMVMNNDGAGSLFQANSLESPVMWAPELFERNILGHVDILFTNPPFGSKIPVTDTAILEKYDLGHTWNYDKASDRWIKTDAVQKSQPPEILFIERCVKFLKPGTGRAAVVLPDGILGSPGLGYVREWILRNTRVLASLDLHPDTFQPDVSIQTSILVLQRKSPELIAVETAAGHINDYSVFMAVANHIGHDKRGNKNYVRDPKGNEVIEVIEELVKEWDGDTPTYQRQTTSRKVVDDNTQQIAQEFGQWLSEQD